MHKVSRSLLFASILALGGLAACGDDITVTDPPVQSATVTVAPNPASVAVGQTVNLVANINGGAAGEAITGWTSSNTSIATVSNTGVVTGVAAGDVAITATSTSGATGSATVRVATESPNDEASVTISSITQGGLQSPVQLNNVAGQIDVTLNVDPGGQNVERVELVVIDSVSGAQTVVASQSITANASVASGIEGLALAIAQANAQAAAMVAANVPQQITLSFNTAAFNPETGAVSFINGRKLIRARLIIAAGSSQNQVASNSIAVTFNNTDGFYVVATPQSDVEGRPQPNSAIGPSGLIWYQAGDGIEVRSVPVMYSGRTVASRTISYAGYTETVTGAGVSTDVIELPSDPPTAMTAVWRDVVQVTAAVSTDGNQITLVETGTINGQEIGTNSNETIGVRNDSLRIDNDAPSGAFSIAESSPDNWVNSAYQFLTSGNLTGVTDQGVGLNGSFPYGFTFQYRGCGSTAYTASATSSGADIAECATDLTNNAYEGRVVMVDKLGNARNTTTVRFGVDKTAPQIAYLNEEQTLTIVRTDDDSVFHNTADTYEDVNSTNAVFGVRYTDERSGFSVDDSDMYPEFRRITRLAPHGTTCAHGGTACAPVRVLGAVESTEPGADPVFRRSVVPIFGTATGQSATTPGYYTYETYVVDRAGNKSATITKRAAIDINQPRITGITVPATLPTAPGTTVAFTPTGTDSLEVIYGSLVLAYPGLADAAIAGDEGVLRYPRELFPMYDAPWNSTLATPVGPGATFGSNGLTVPNRFIGRLETVGAGNIPQNYGTEDLKPDSVGANLYDIKLTSGWATEADSNAAAAAGTSATRWAPIFETQVPNGTAFFGRTTGAMVTQWFILDTEDGDVRVRATGPTVAINPPFTNIVIVRYNSVTNEWDYVRGTLSAVVTNDQGETRFYTWTFTPAEGEEAFDSGDQIRAIGIDANGNGLSTLTFGTVAPPAPGV